MIWPASMIRGQRKDRCKPGTSGETRTFGSTGWAWTRLWTCSRSPWPTSRPCLGAAYQLWPFSAWLLLFKCLTSPTRFGPRTFWSIWLEIRKSKIPTCPCATLLWNTFGGANLCPSSMLGPLNLVITFKILYLCYCTRKYYSKIN